MHGSARDAYLETQITTATPQRLRLMLIDGALRRARTAQEAWEVGRVEEGTAAAGHCRDIIAELIAGISPDESPLAGKVLCEQVRMTEWVAEDFQTGLVEVLTVDKDHDLLKGDRKGRGDRPAHVDCSQVKHLPEGTYRLRLNTFQGLSPKGERVPTG